MGRTSKPLRILATAEIVEWPEVSALVAQGHVVHTVMCMDTNPYDLVLGPTCHMMTEAERPWLGDAVAAARKRRYGVPLTQEEDAS